MPELSIVIPSFDTASMTLGCCRGVLGSMPDDAELIVVDDGSADGTAELLGREAPQARVIRLPSNRGFAAAANCGVGEARGRIILLLNSDAMVEAASLAAIVVAFNRDPALGVAGARLLNADGTPQWSGGATPTLPWMIGVVSGAGHLARLFRGRGNGRRQVDWVSGAAMAFRSEVWKDAGPLDERFLFYCQDIDFCLRARQGGWQVAIVEEARVTHGLGGTVAPDDPLGHDPERLWCDLLTWGRLHYGAAWGAVARVTLVAAACMRIAGRVIRRPFRHDATTATLRRALRRLVQSDS
jgi:GT2 family glycosyltransferase